MTELMVITRPLFVPQTNSPGLVPDSARLTTYSECRMSFPFDVSTISLEAAPPPLAADAATSPMPGFSPADPLQSSAEQISQASIRPQVCVQLHKTL